MKTILKISIVLNLGLFSGLLLVLVHKPGALEPESPAVINGSQKNEAARAISAISRDVGEKSFCWSQLESGDYHVYIKNLRRSGCPELTLRAIVTADVDEAYAQQSHELEEKLTGLENNTSWSAQLKSFDAQQTLKNELQKLPGEEAAEIADLLGLKPAPADDDAGIDSTSPATGSRRNPPDVPVVMPLVFQNVDLSALKLNNDERQAIEDLRQNFLEQIGGADQNPDDPAYRERWQKAQPEIDSTLRGLIGGSAFENYQLAASDHAQ